MNSAATTATTSGVSTLTFGSATMSGGVLVPTGDSPAPSRAPKALVATQATQIQQGWVGQIVVGEIIVWQSKPCEDSHAAERKATQRVLKKFARLFA